MKKVIIHLSFLMCLSLLLDGCSKSSVTPSPAEQKASLLAGKTGSFKQWKISGGTVSSNGVPGTLTLDPCFLDDIYQFNNNNNQDYVQTEGATLCTVGDPQSIESGNWALSFDATQIFVEGIENNGNQGVFIAFYEPGKIISLTTTSMQVNFTQVSGTSTTVFSLSFVAI